MPFRDLIGQARAIRFLHRALMTGRIAHAYLFTGPVGVGKPAAALAFAQARTCERVASVEFGVSSGYPTPDTRHPTPMDGCGECRACRNIANGLHPDVQIIEPDGATVKIEQIRTLEADAALVPYEAQWKAFILNSAERMTEQAANALLKTLEEPAKDTVFILLTSTVSALLPTIVSRCQIVTFSPLPHGEIEALLGEKGMEASRARLIASLSRGSIERAFSPEEIGRASCRERV